MRPICFLFEVGAIGYSQWKVPKNSDSDLNKSFNPKDQIHAVGGGQVVLV